MFRTVFKLVAFTALFAAPVFADDLPAPEGDVLLTISGNVDVPNVDKSVQLDLAMFKELEQTIIETSTIWTEGTQTFEGVSLKTLVDTFGITGETLRATAINDYAVEIPLSDAIEGGAIIAYRLNDKTMSVREKGPLWVVYPYDADSKFRTEVVYSRSIWQLDRLQAMD